MASGPITHVLVPTPPDGAVTHTVTGAASAELDTTSASGTRWRFHSITSTSFVVFGESGSVAEPTASNGIPVPANTYVDFYVPAGWKFRVFASSAGELVWYRMAI